MEILEKTEAECEELFSRILEGELNLNLINPIEWPSLFSNLIRPRIKNLSEAREFYLSLTGEQVCTRMDIHIWEKGAWYIYITLENLSFDFLEKSIDPKLWAEKEIRNIELLLREGKNQLIIAIDDFCTEKIPEIYIRLVNGEWNDFISLEELDCYLVAESKYVHENSLNFSDSESAARANSDLFCTRTLIKQFLNEDYIVAQEIQALLWYKEYLKK